MHKQIATLFETQFEEDVYKGLTDYPKHLSSKYFYDANGDALFQDIMHMPEYYLTNSEFEILDEYKQEILLRHFSESNIEFTYHPIDISQNVLNLLETSLQKELPRVQVKTEQGTYFETLEKINSNNGIKKVILFLGSNIGNLLHPQAIDFLKSIQRLMQNDDLFVVGFDQKKHPKTILDAYNDKAGITEAFNKNVLTRMNRELKANFDLDQFLHWEVYDPETGTAKSYLVSKKEQTVFLEKIRLQVDFGPWETIHTEISQKYDERTVQWLAVKSGLQIENVFVDSKGYYKNYVFKKRR